MELPFGNNYVVDTDVLIILMKHYPPDKPTFNAIWDEIENLIKQGNMFTTDVVYKEIGRYEGKGARLKNWAKSQKSKRRFFIGIDAETWQLAKKIRDKFPALIKQKNIETGEEEADPFLIALAKAKGATIITNERKDLFDRIPAIAKHYGIKSIDLFEFFAERGLKFVKEQ